MLGHHDVAKPTDAVLGTYGLHRSDEAQFRPVVPEELKAPEARNCEEVNLAKLVVSAKTTGHANSLPLF